MRDTGYARDTGYMHYSNKLPQTPAPAKAPKKDMSPVQKAAQDDDEEAPICGHRSDNPSSATGQEAGGSTTSDAGLGTTLSLPGLNIGWPFSQLILAGVKTAEV